MTTPSVTICADPATAFHSPPRFAHAPAASVAGRPVDDAGAISPVDPERRRVGNQRERLLGRLEGGVDRALGGGQSDHPRLGVVGRKGQEEVRVDAELRAFTPHEVERGLAHGLASSRRRRDLDANPRRAQIDLGHVETERVRHGLAVFEVAHPQVGVDDAGLGLDRRPGLRRQPNRQRQHCDRYRQRASNRRHGRQCSGVAQVADATATIGAMPAPRSNSLALLAVLLLSACSSPAPAPAPSATPAGPGATAPFDVVIANGRVVDGTGAPWFRADIGIVGDRITAVGNLSARDRRQPASTPPGSWSRRGSSTCSGSRSSTCWSTAARPARSRRASPPRSPGRASRSHR